MEHQRDAPGLQREAAPEAPLSPATSAAARFAATLQQGAGNRAASEVLGAPRRSLGHLPRRDGMLLRSIAQSMPTSQGVFDVDMQTQQDALTGTGPSGLKGTIGFEPAPKSPYTNKLGLVQIVKLTDAGGANVDSASMPAAATPHLRTKEDAAAGVEKGYLTDVLHHDPDTGLDAQKGVALPSYYPFGPKGGNQEFGFRRSEKAVDIKATKLFDFPGTDSKALDLDFAFETAAKGDDNQHVYGSLKWAFGLRAGKVVNETSSVHDSQSATYDAALERHEDFYVLEPVTMYFDFGADAPAAGEEAKLARVEAYLTKFTDVRVHAEGFADLRGGAASNLALARRRAQSCLDLLAGRGIDPARFDAPVARGATSSFTADAGAGRQDEEEIRRANRRVTLTFEHTVSTP